MVIAAKKLKDTYSLEGNFSVHVLLKPSLENFEHCLLVGEMGAMCGGLNILWHLMQRADSLEKTLMLCKIEDRRRRGRQRMRWLESITDSVDMNLSKLGDSGGQRSLVCCSP